MNGDYHETAISKKLPQTSYEAISIQSLIAQRIFLIEPGWIPSVAYASS